MTTPVLKWIHCDDTLWHHMTDITRTQWVNLLWPSDTTWRYRPGSTLAQIMTWCLLAPSHYLNQCWLIISDVPWQSPEANFIRDIIPPSIYKITLSITYPKFHSNLPGANELNSKPQLHPTHLLVSCQQGDLLRHVNRGGLFSNVYHGNLL